MDNITSLGAQRRNIRQLVEEGKSLMDWTRLINWIAQSTSLSKQLFEATWMEMRSRARLQSIVQKSPRFLLKTWIIIPSARFRDRSDLLSWHRETALV
jgi:organic radical activating enzyme